MAALPQFKQAQLARRSTSDIERLAAQFRSGVDSVTAEYQKAFGTYRQSAAEQLAPFEAAMSRYQTQDMPAYEAARAKYQKDLEAYNATLKAIEADPVTAKTERVFVGRTWYGKKKYQDVTSYEPKAIPKFESKMPEIPGAPQAPTIAAFDDSQFKQKTQQLQSDLTREVGERRAAKLGAVGRRSARPLLQGV
jgi:hypothetical protein